jgi:hypothetical protein
MSKAKAKEPTLQSAKNHEEFAIRSQLLRWFHERTNVELEAMRMGLIEARSKKGHSHG